MHKALLDSGFEVLMFSREDSTSTDSLSGHPKQKIVKIDIDDVDRIASGLKGIDGVVSNVASHALLSQKKLIDAAIVAGFRRFLPSDFGTDLSNEANTAARFNEPKVEIQEYVKNKSKAYPNFSYTSVVTGPLFHWSMAFGVFGDLQAHHMMLWDSGETRVSTTTLAWSEKLSWVSSRT